MSAPSAQTVCVCGGGGGAFANLKPFFEKGWSKGVGHVCVAREGRVEAAQNQRWDGRGRRECGAGAHCLRSKGGKGRVRRECGTGAHRLRIKVGW
eukprot:345449-Chlamydomonas_euryale.AAC.2